MSSFQDQRGRILSYVGSGVIDQKVEREPTLEAFEQYNFNCEQTGEVQNGMM